MGSVSALCTCSKNNGRLSRDNASAASFFPQADVLPKGLS